MKRINTLERQTQAAPSDPILAKVRKRNPPTSAPPMGYPSRQLRYVQIRSHPDAQFANLAPHSFLIGFTDRWRKAHKEAVTFAILANEECYRTIL